MKLVKVTSDQLNELMGWFNSEAELRIWSGPFLIIHLIRKALRMI